MCYSFALVLDWKVSYLLLEWRRRNLRQDTIVARRWAGHWKIRILRALGKPQNIYEGQYRYETFREQINRIMTANVRVETRLEYVRLEFRWLNCNISELVLLSNVNRMRVVRISLTELDLALSQPIKHRNVLDGWKTTDGDEKKISNDLTWQQTSYWSKRRQIYFYWSAYEIIVENPQCDRLQHCIWTVKIITNRQRCYKSSLKIVLNNIS